MATSTGGKRQQPVITVLGSLNMDLVSYVPHHPLPGETMTSSRFAVSPGGKGANQAVACAKLSRSHTSADADADPNDESASAHIRMLGAVGDDSYGSQMLANLRRHGVDASGVTASPSLKTGLAIIIVDEPTGENRIVLSPEANHSLFPSQFSSPSSLGDPLPELLIMQLEIPLPTVLAALRAAREARVPVLLNPAPAQTLPPEAYDGLAHLVVNETEAAELSQVPLPKDEDYEPWLPVVGDTFLKRGARTVIVTLGSRGVYYVTADGKKGLVPAEKAKVVDTTAAGDTFVGQYALEIVSGNFDIEDAVKKANHAAAKTVERLGAQDSIPWRDEL
ncbi:Ribokinase-like protein [Hypomontagnella submonticulosa]|nr:Ribokinase-like protein [Hypomontagnella submonticulosa]